MIDQCGRTWTRDPEEALPVTAAAGTLARPQPIAVPLREIALWAVFAGFMMLFLLYFVGLEQGATSLLAGSAVHEWMHDARHLLGFPCH
jgi:cobalt transporter subunit CbtB